MLWCEDRGPKKNGVSDVRRKLKLSESVGEHIKWICWSSTVAMNYKIMLLGSISKDLNLTQSLIEGQAFIDMESRQDSVSTDKHD
ncbi:hypothetical protein ACROYT_G038797 [Oculina patagonica]